MSKIKRQKSEPETISVRSREPDDYPVFCFRHLQQCPKKDHKFSTRFIERLSKLANMTWLQIDKSDRHGFGTENIPLHIINKKMPEKIVTPEVRHLTAFRANGDNRPFLGLRRENVFHIIFIEENFGDIYSH